MVRWLISWHDTLALYVPPIIYKLARKSSTFMIWETLCCSCHWLSQTDKMFPPRLLISDFCSFSRTVETRWGNHKCQPSLSVIMVVVETNIECVTVSLALSPNNLLQSITTFRLSKINQDRSCCKTTNKVLSVASSDCFFWKKFLKK